MEGYLSPRESGRFVSERARHVSILDEAVGRLSQLVANAAQKGKLSHEALKYDSVFPTDANLTLKQLMNWTFLVDSINFNFWTMDKEPKYVVSHGKTTRAGYLGMVTAVNRAIAEGKPMYDPKYYGSLSLEDLKHIFRSKSSSTLPLFEERMQVLKDVAKTLKDKYNGCFSHVVEEAEGDAVKLVNIITREFESFRDVATYDNQGISLLKRAQIVAADLDLLFSIKNLPGLANMESLTMFADYRVPQVLLFYGVLQYSVALRQKVKEEFLFSNGSLEEVEIRACSIEAVERIVKETRKVLESRGCSAEEAKELVSSARVDYFLWDFRVENAKGLTHVPYHRTRCIYY